MNDREFNFRAEIFRGKLFSRKRDSTQAAHPSAIWGAVRLTLLSSLWLGVVGCDGLDSTASPSGTPSGSQAASAGGNSFTSENTQIPRGIQETTFDDIKFEMEKTEPFQREMITEKIENLDGRRIRIRGYILPTYVSTGLDEFVLVRDNQECCFGPGAALFDCILVKMQPGKTTDYTDLPVAVEGAFRIEQFRLSPKGRTLAIYQMVGESVK